MSAGLDKTQSLSCPWSPAGHAHNLDLLGREVQLGMLHDGARIERRRHRNRAVIRRENADH